MRFALAVLVALFVLAAPARAQEMSSNVASVASIPELKSAIAINFIDDAMFVSTATGVFSYDVSDPASPKALGALPMYIWENEDMDVDVERERLFISRDPRGFTSPATPGAAFPVGAVHIIDVSDPALMKQVGFFTLPAGHTSTCVNDCDFLWTGGPFANEQTQPDFVGRPIYATDVSDPADPKPCPDPIDTGRNDGVTDYVHDVQVDSRGVAWVSGAGGVRGYWTSGEHENPVTGEVERATACRPVPYAGSGTPEDATPSRFMHNSFRDPGPVRAPGAPAPAGGSAAAGETATVAPAVPQAGAQSRAAKPAAKARCKVAKAKKKPSKTSRRKRARTRKGATARAAGKRKPRKRKAARRVTCAKAKKRPRRVSKVTVRSASATAATTRAEAPRASRIADERILYATEENLDDDCTKSGRFVTYDLTGTFGGEGFRDVATAKHRMKVLDTWTPEAQEGATGCASAHYFASRGDGVFANAFYEQGVRFLDVSNPRDIRQIGWWRPDDANTFATYFRDGHVFVADFTRGVEILRFDGSPGRGKSVRPPALARAVTQRMDPELGYLCPLKAPV